MKKVETHKVIDTVFYEGTQYTKTTTEKVVNEICVNYINEFTPGIKYPLTWDKMKNLSKGA